MPNDLNRIVICTEDCEGCEHNSPHKYSSCQSSCDGGGEYQCPACVLAKDQRNNQCKIKQEVNMKYCPTCGQEVIRDREKEPKQTSEMNELYKFEIVRFFRCPQGHVFRGIFSPHNGPSLYREEF
jgi:hypothetical protein